MVREQGGETRGLEKGEGSFLAPVALCIERLFLLRICVSRRGN